MILDLHMHTILGSADSNLTVENAAKKISAKNLDGACLTEHSSIWEKNNNQIEDIFNLYNLKVFRAIEISTSPTIVENSKGQRLGVINVMTQLFMKPIDTPYVALEEALEALRLQGNVDAILVDVHGEATSEKMGIGLFCDGYVSAVVGTHTHIPTADVRILEGGTAFQTDAGMCGCYDSVIGMDKDVMLHRMSTQLPGERMRPAEGEGGVCGLYVEIDESTGLATRAEPVRMGPHLSEAVPE